MARKYLRSSYIYAFILGLMLGVFFYINFIWAPKAKAQLIDPTGSPVVSTLKSGQDKSAAGEKPTVQEVKDYIKVIFGSKWKLAWSVFENECNHTRKEWPVCVNSWEKERSIGIAQINLAKNNGLGQKVHWDKVPGKNLKEKELWLSDWKNNILTAYRISEGGNNFQPWTAYSSGNYLHTLKDL